MPIAAVPQYLGQDFKDASPGMRFGLLLPIWTDRQDQENQVKKQAERKSSEGREIAEMLRRYGMDATIAELCRRQCNPLPGLWEKNDFAARNAWDSIKVLTPNDRKRMKALVDRQTDLTCGIPDDALLRLDAIATSPFTTGLGNEHPLENGFSFLWPYGLPYLPGSGVKGVLRQAARELASGEWGETHEWDVHPHPKSLSPRERDFPLPSPASGRGDGDKGQSVIDILFGFESKDGDTEHLRGALSFWDVIPQIEGDSLLVEIMTPHQSHYYQEKRDRKTGDSITPHDSGQPTPIFFLTVPPGSGFTFHVQCDLAHLDRLAPELTADSQWKKLIEAAFEHAFQWLGFGAKTAVGYGAMRSDKQRQALETAAAERAAQLKEIAKKQEEKRQAEQAVPWPGARIKFNRNNGTLSVEKDGKIASALAPQGKELLETLPSEIQKKVLANQFIKVTAYVCEKTLIRLETA
ncbi:MULTISPECIES: type III-B CRISPR module RAMP protein Cmr6 [Methylococcus]|uniref:Type III-B CRISPR module RAMP protein Cmr6 n=1 Tax=Methylococcus capsulatus TaxID=414 RepID=A0ABZ2F240_METCP|nr:MULTISPECIES: type III-B CRISPR module RAMP protein Cmr6 [Methylococcus]MDF9391726.1 type III-B CRISPR module RAMP protein Cmr6 [Methylococcus capsulatus]